MDFLGNQTRMNFRGNRMGHGFSRKSNEDEFSRKSNGAWILLGIKGGLQKNNNNNMIRLVPMRIESGRGK